MSRRKQNNAIDGLYDIFVAVPGWVPLLAAAIVYGGLRFLPLFSSLALYAASGILLLGLAAQFGKR